MNKKIQDKKPAQRSAVKRHLVLDIKKLEVIAAPGSGSSTTYGTNYCSRGW